MSYADQCFIRDCRRILDEGDRQTEGLCRAHWADGAPAYAQKIFCLVNRYDLEKEFPALTIRPIPFKNCVDEILWIWQKKSNVVAELQSHIWDQWMLNDGTIGKAYGYQLGKVTHYRDGDYDQVDRLLKDLRENPWGRRHIAHMYNIEDLPEMALYPCAYSMTFNISGGRLNALLNQRSQDMLVANGWNVCQYAVLLHMFARHLGLVAGELVHVIADAHIYDRHVAMVEELLQRPQYPAPKLWIDPAIHNFYDFKAEHFKLLDYEHGPQIKNIPVAI